jgi:RNA-directed DNA polymerase
MELKFQKTSETLREENRGEASTSSPEGNSSTTNKRTESPNFPINLMEEVLSQSNLNLALKRVRQNKGSAGIDNMSVNGLPSYLKREWEAIKLQLFNGRYKPSPVKRVNIPKADGGVRQLGIPTVLDRFIQQALTQVLQSGYDKTFSDSSFGFRPKRSAHQAVLKAQSYQNEGYRIVVDIDLEKFFDRVNHDKLMGKLRKDIQDKRVLKLVRAYLNAGVMKDGIVTTPDEGTPQGGPLSPLLSNIVLDELDVELEGRGHKFVRYADDCNIYVKTIRSGERVMNGLKSFISKKLKLKVNEEKSKVAKPSERKFLGFSFTSEEKVRKRIAPKSIKRFKEKVREITRPTRRIKFVDLIAELRVYLIGWKGYFKLAEAKSILRDLDSWIRHRLRNYIWQQWRRGKTRHKMLMKFGVGHDLALQTAASGKGGWRVSNSPALSFAFPKKYFDKFGLPRLNEEV